MRTLLSANDLLASSFRWCDKGRWLSQPETGRRTFNTREWRGSEKRFYCIIRDAMTTNFALRFTPGGDNSLNMTPGGGTNLVDLDDWIRQTSKHIMSVTWNGTYKDEKRSARDGELKGGLKEVGGVGGDEGKEGEKHSTCQWQEYGLGFRASHMHVQCIEPHRLGESHCHTLKSWGGWWGGGEV